MSRDRELARALGKVRVPGERDAEDRAWQLVRAAYAERTPAKRPTAGRRFALAGAVGAVLLAIGLSPAGAKVGDAIQDVFGLGEPDAKPQLRSLPATGELLVDSGQGAWIVREDGSKRLLGDYDQASWSPHGLYVAVAQGRELAAVDTAGDPRWTFPAPGVVRDPRWAGDAADTRIAYRSGADLRVIAGDGNPATDRLIARDVAPMAPAWRPIGYSKLGPPAANGFVLSYLTGDGEIRSVNVDSGARVPTRRAIAGGFPSRPRAGSRTGPYRPTASALRGSSTWARATGCWSPTAAAGARSSSPPAAGSPGRPGLPTGAGCSSAGPPPISGCSSTPRTRAG